MGPLRKVCQVDWYQTRSHARRAWSVELTLSCGHVVYRKSSDWRGGRVHCRMCEVQGPDPKRRTR